MPKHTVIYPGSFDPPTYGHMNIVDRALKIFDKVIIAVANNKSKENLLSSTQRVELLKKLYKNQPNVEIDHFQGLLVEYARAKGVHSILRGLRTVADYEYELQMSFSNKHLNPGIETIFMMTENRLSHISSTLIKEILHFGGVPAGMLDPVVEKAIQTIIQNKKS